MASQPWRSKRFAGGESRLKPAVIDDLDRVGLPSKGDNSLLSFQLQEQYFVQICERCQKLSVQTKAKDGLADIQNAFSKLEIQQQQPDLKHGRRDVVLMAMRKLREGIIASARVDRFAVDAYKFIIRTAISWQAWEAYQPALLYFLHRIHPRNPLPEPEIHEFVSYRVLDLACRLSEYGLAYLVRSEWQLKDDLVDRVLTALVRCDWRAFWQCQETANELQTCLIAKAESRMQSSAVQGLTRAYFTVDKPFASTCTGTTVEELVQSKAVDWSLDGDKVTVRRIKGR